MINFAITNLMALNASLIFLCSDEKERKVLGIMMMPFFFWGAIFKHIQLTITTSYYAAYAIGFFLLFVFYLFFYKINLISKRLVLSSIAIATIQFVAGAFFTQTPEINDLTATAYVFASTIVAVTIFAFVQKINKNKSSPPRK